MRYVLCSVLWTDCKAVPGFSAAGIFSSTVYDDKDCGKVYDKFILTEYSSAAEHIKAFVNFCTKDSEEFMLCFWDGLSAGRMKKLLDICGARHPYVHMYHLKKIYELTVSRTSDIKKKKLLEAKLKDKPRFSDDEKSAEAEVKWLCSLFPLLDFSVMEKSPNVDYLDKPSNNYFVFKNGKCFHTSKCCIVRDAAVSSLRAYTYYENALSSGFTPCSRCKPQNLDEEIYKVMQKINSEKKAKVKQKKKKKADIYKSLSHMCNIYKLSYERKDKTVYFSNGKDTYKLNPEEDPVRLFKKINGKYEEVGLFTDAYIAVKSIFKQGNKEKRQVREKDEQ